MKYFLLFFLSAALLSCNEKAKKNKLPANSQNNTTGYDTLKFNGLIRPDTTGCMWIVNDRYVLDTLIFEEAIVRVTEPIVGVASDTFLSTRRYGRLWACSIPNFIMIPYDTVLISGYVYKIFDVEHTVGRPALINQIAFSRKNK